MKTYLINLDASADRLACATEQFAKHNLTFERISAFDGRGLNPTDYAAYNDVACRRHLGRSMNGGELGCFVSHQRALKKFVDSGDKICAILEDDFAWTNGATDDFLILIEWLSDRADQWDVINIGNQAKKLSSHLEFLNDREIRRAHYFPMLTTGLIWTRTGAENFLRKSQTISMPYDNMMRHVMSQTDRGLSVSPPLVHSTGVASDIDDGNKRTNTKNRSLLYGVRNQRRLWREKARALWHLARNS